MTRFSRISQHIQQGALFLAMDDYAVAEEGRIGQWARSGCVSNGIFHGLKAPVVAGHLCNISSIPQAS